MFRTHSENQIFFNVLEDDALTKAVQLPKSLSKTIHFFDRGKPNDDGIKKCTNIRILHTDYMKSIISDLRHDS